ncbi:MAG: hypothetical protein ACYTEX_20510 [Planctomycetota bacterium]
MKSDCGESAGEDNNNSLRNRRHRGLREITNYRLQNGGFGDRLGVRSELRYRRIMNFAIFSKVKDRRNRGRKGIWGSQLPGTVIDETELCLEDCQENEGRRNDSR